MGTKTSQEWLESGNLNKAKEICNELLQRVNEIHSQEIRLNIHFLHVEILWKENKSSAYLILKSSVENEILTDKQVPETLKRLKN